MKNPARITPVIPIFSMVLTMLFISGCTPLLLPDARLHGAWRQIDAGPMAVVMTFGPDAQLTLSLEGDDGRTITGSYSVDWSQEPAHLDIDWGEDGRVATILDFPDEETLRVENANPGDPRPTEFTENAVRLVRTDEIAAAPAATVQAPRPTARTAATPGQDRTTGPANLLRYVPDTPDYRRYTAFGDYAAWLEAWSIPRPADINGLELMSKAQRDRWIYTMMRRTTPPAALGLQYSFMESMADWFGFSFFDRDQFLEAGQPPDVLTVTTPGDADGAVASALLESGYTAAPLTGEFTLYSMRDDYEIDINAPTRIGQMGELNRIATGDDVLIIGRATGVVEAAMSAAESSGSLAHAPDVQALLRSLDAPGLANAGALVGLILVGEPYLIDVADLVLGDDSPDEVKAQWETLTNREPPLPPYLLTGFATYRAPDATYLALHAVFPTADTAAAAADILAARMESYASLVTDERLPWTLEDAFADGEAAIIVMRADESEGQPDVFSWIDLIVRRDTAFLVTE